MLWLVSTAVGYFRSVNLAEDRYDHELVNSADSVIARLEVVNGKVVVDLPPQALAILRHGNNKFYYQILTKDMAKLSGDIGLPGPQDDLLVHVPRMSYGVIDGEKVRVCTLRTPVEGHNEYTVIVEVAETVKARDDFAHQLLIGIIVPQLLLIGLGGLAIWQGVSRGLSPLIDLEQALASRSQFDLSARCPMPPLPMRCAPLSIQLTICLADCARILIRKEDLSPMLRINCAPLWPD